MVASALPHALIHPSAWKDNSPKYISTILNMPLCRGEGTPHGPTPMHGSQHKMLWCCIDMRLADQRPEHLPVSNECARRRLKVATTFGCVPYLVGASCG